MINQLSYFESSNFYRCVIVLPLLILNIISIVFIAKLKKKVTNFFDENGQTEAIKNLFLLEQSLQ